MVFVIKYTKYNYKRVGKNMKFDFAVLLPVLIAFGISVVLSPVMIPFLKKLKFGQFVRDDGPVGSKPPAKVIKRCKAGKV